MAKSAQGAKASEFGLAMKAAVSVIRQHKTPRERYRALNNIVSAQLLQLAEEGDAAYMKKAIQEFDFASAESVIFD